MITLSDRDNAMRPTMNAITNRSLSSRNSSLQPNNIRASALNSKKSVNKDESEFTFNTN